MNCNLPAAVTANLELTTQCNPWVIGAAGTDVEGSSNPVLSVDPGVTISVAAGGYLAVGLTSPGTLQVNGTSDKPVTFTSSTTTPGAWVGILLSDHSSGSIITSATVSYAGSPPSILPGVTPYFGSIVVGSSGIRVGFPHGTSFVG